MPRSRGRKGGGGGGSAPAASGYSGPTVTYNAPVEITADAPSPASRRPRQPAGGAGRPGTPRASSAAGGQQQSPKPITCQACSAAKPRLQFSKAQLSRRGSARCKKCVAESERAEQAARQVKGGGGGGSNGGSSDPTPPQAKKARAGGGGRAKPTKGAAAAAVGETLRISTHFFPKFDNQSEGKKLSMQLPASAAEREQFTLAVTKKHSGSLLMAPPFFSKNSTGNLYSRVGAWLMREHFEAAWAPLASDPGSRFTSGAAAFKGWWQHAEEHGLCYSFECVTPRLLGDHGATPLSAYLVLTAVSSTPDGRFLSPGELLVVATMWRLPVNEAWYIPAKRAGQVEDALHKARWTADDGEATQLLDEALLGDGAKLSFLSHTETQGHVLEGFVILLMRADLSGLEQLTQAYSGVMKPRAAACLAAARSAGERCLRGDKSLNKMNESALFERLDWCPEPTRGADTGGARPASELWELAVSGDGRVGQLFRCLQRSYPHAAKLLDLSYGGAPMMQVHVLADEVFYGWRLHELAFGASPIYRGMVVSADGRQCKALDLGAVPQTQIESIAKLKCLRYLMRTFGIRNNLPTLLGSGSAAYMARTTNFFRNWSVPAEHRAEYSRIFTQWAQFVDSAPANVREELKSRCYLQHLEPLLDQLGGAARAPSGEEEATTVTVLAANLTGKPLSAEQTEAVSAGRSEFSSQLAMKNTISPGSFCVMKNPPRPLMLKGAAEAGGREAPVTGAILAVFEPPEGGGAKGQVPQKFFKMAEKVRRDEQGGQYAHPTALVLYNPSKQDIAKATESLEELVASAPPPAALPIVSVVAVCALPPGGGKSTFFEALAAAAGSPARTASGSAGGGASAAGGSGGGGGGGGGKRRRGGSAASNLNNTAQRLKLKLGSEEIEEDAGWTVTLTATKEDGSVAVQVQGQGRSKKEAKGKAAEGAMSHFDSAEGGGGGGGGGGAPASKASPLAKSVVAKAAGGGGARQQQVAIISSDGLREQGKKAFDAMLDLAVRDGGAGNGPSCIGYDKNIPDPTGLDKMVRLLSAAGAKHGVDVRVTLVVPASIDGDACWERVLSRPKTHIGLHTHGELSAAKAKGLLQSAFLQPSERWRPAVAAQPAAIESDAFWQSVGAVRQLAATALAAAPSGQKLADIDTFESSGDSPHPERRSGNWIAVSFEGIGAHVTLVPPAAPTAKEEGARKRALATLGKFHGQSVTVRVAGRYNAASSPISGSVPRGRNAPRRTSSQTKVSRARVCFWEVESISLSVAAGQGSAGNQEFRAAQFAPQAAIYHITDVASCAGGAKPKSAAEALSQSRGVERNGSPVKGSGAEWVLECWEHEPFELVGKVEIK